MRQTTIHFIFAFTTITNKTLFLDSIRKDSLITGRLRFQCRSERCWLFFNSVVQTFFFLVCGYCKSMKPDYYKAAEILSEELVSRPYQDSSCGDYALGSDWWCLFLPSPSQPSLISYCFVLSFLVRFNKIFLPLLFKFVASSVD